MSDLLKLNIEAKDIAMDGLRVAQGAIKSGIGDMELWKQQLEYWTHRVDFYQLEIERLEAQNA